jgi:uncharacterized protein YbcV (DUF1398 family)
VYDALLIEDECTPSIFAEDLKAHQAGKTDYFQFCKDCAKSGIEKWIVSLEDMTCIYYDKKGNQILVETIPIPSYLKDYSKIYIVRMQIILKLVI